MTCFLENVTKARPDNQTVTSLKWFNRRFIFINKAFHCTTGNQLLKIERKIDKETIFVHSYTRLKRIKRPVIFRELVWSIMGYNSPIMQMDRDTLPYVEEFRDFFLKRSIDYEKTPSLVAIHKFVKTIETF
ncbi:Hypothetical predicted protein [Octopus vulgaris]|uniref:Uncharacterized protein n=1 Tax=Octopus vulgaris TaxID=6645 RepID=A0AA36APR7_OCTVU|nr:Hypothetical predicted protein [Octopus vulgaris]